MKKIASFLDRHRVLLVFLILALIVITNICFIFMNPTGRNMAVDPGWKGKRSPWIGTKNIWKLFYSIGLLDEKIYKEI